MLLVHASKYLVLINVDTNTVLWSHYLPYCLVVFYPLFSVNTKEWRLWSSAAENIEHQGTYEQEQQQGVW